MKKVTAILLAISLLPMQIVYINEAQADIYSENVVNYVDIIENMDSGSVVYLSLLGSLTELSDIDSIYLATLDMLLKKSDVKLIIQLVDIDAYSVFEEYQSFLKIEANYGKIEGVDYVVLPNYGGYGTGFTVIAMGFSRVFTEDWNGNGLETLPIMDNIKNFDDVDITITHHFLEYNWVFLEYEMQNLCWGYSGTLSPFIDPYYNPETGPVYGYVEGVSQGEELCQLVNYLYNKEDWSDLHKEEKIDDVFYESKLDNIKVGDWAEYRWISSDDPSPISSKLEVINIINYTAYFVVTFNPYDLYGEEEMFLNFDTREYSMNNLMWFILPDLEIGDEVVYEWDEFYAIIVDTLPNEYSKKERFVNIIEYIGEGSIMGKSNDETKLQWFFDKDTGIFVELNGVSLVYGDKISVYITNTNIWNYINKEETTHTVIIDVPYYYQYDTLWCGPTALSNVLKSYKVDVKYWDIAQWLELEKEQGVDLSQGNLMHKNLEHYLISNHPQIWTFTENHVSTETVFTSIQSHIDSGHPVLLALKKESNDERHIITVVGYDESGFYVHDSGNMLDFEWGLLELTTSDINRYIEWEVLEPFVYLGEGDILGTHTGTLSIIEGESTSIGGTIDIGSPEDNPGQSSIVIASETDVNDFTFLDIDDGLTWRNLERGITSGDVLWYKVGINNHLDEVKSYLLTLNIRDSEGEFHYSAEKIVELNNYSREETSYEKVFLGDALTETRSYHISLRLFDNQMDLIDEITTPVFQYEYITVEEPYPSPSPKPESPGGIPGFSIEAVLVGVLLSVLLIWYSRRLMAS